jgi:hypothetical protein
MPDGGTQKTLVKAKLLLDAKKPAKTVDIVPNLKHNSLLSAGKVADAGYVSVLTPSAVLIYHQDKYTPIPKEAVL